MTTESLRRIDTARPVEPDMQYAELVDESRAERYTLDPLEVHFGRVLPVELIKRYAKLAARRADTEQVDDGTWFASVRGFEGVWAQGDTEEEARAAVESVVIDWTCFKIVDKDRDLPILDTIDLNVI